MSYPSSSSSSERLKKQCMNPVSSNCVTWDGEDLEIIEVCKGDSISDIQYKVALIIQAILDGENLSTLDLKCLLTDCVSCPAPEKTVKNVISLLIEKVCSLETILNSLELGGSSSSLPDIPLGCLSYTNSEGDLITHGALDSVVKIVIQQVCKDKEKIVSHESTLGNHEERLVELEGKEQIPLPLVTSDCLFGGQRPVTDAFEALDSDYCNFKSVLGTAAQFQQAFTKVCNDLNSKLGSQSGWNPSPTNLAQYFSNLYILGCNVLTRVDNIEKTCCPTGCSSLVVGFIITFGTNTATLKFTAGAGTFIPDGFTDCGSILTITNQKNVKTTISLPVVAGGETDDIDLSMFAAKDTLSFSLAVKMCSDSVVCEKCVSKTAEFLTNCPICEISGTGKTGTVTILYTT